MQGGGEQSQGMADDSLLFQQRPATPVDSLDEGDSFGLGTPGGSPGSCCLDLNCCLSSQALLAALPPCPNTPGDASIDPEVAFHVRFCRE